MPSAEMEINLGAISPCPVDNWDSSGDQTTLQSASPATVFGFEPEYKVCQPHPESSPQANFAEWPVPEMPYFFNPDSTEFTPQMPYAQNQVRVSEPTSWPIDLHTPVKNEDGPGSMYFTPRGETADPVYTWYHPLAYSDSSTMVQPGTPMQEKAPTLLPSQTFDYGAMSPSYRGEKDAEEWSRKPVRRMCKKGLRGSRQPTQARKRRDMPKVPGVRLRLNEPVKVCARKKLRCQHILEDGEQCSGSFWRVEHLTRHEKIHTGELPFRCRVAACTNKGLGRQDNLRDHYKTHLKMSDSGRNERYPADKLFELLREKEDPEEAEKIITKLKKWMADGGHLKDFRSSSRKLH
ncbi:hypothetical protein EJ06DRAFT_560231 [Trichodelitschia bisporula]|uniref:C2H2-type domain-containing protein n=1 Tax=Trichodelitschia bisporula TaxID=703511 RepID=A0A6G1HJF9_9PEZI|nr:hypothetical protein EJ06DRAFT_560231 [Trichodelitschia bisporula]